MRTRSDGPGQSVQDSSACNRRAAATASDGRLNASPKPSPAVANTYPSHASTASRTAASCTLSDADIPSGSAGQHRVEPSTSVNKNVTVPDGRAPPPPVPTASSVAPRQQQRKALRPPSRPHPRVRPSHTAGPAALPDRVRNRGVTPSTTRTLRTVLTPAAAHAVTCPAVVMPSPP